MEKNYDSISKHKIKPQDINCKKRKVRYVMRIYIKNN